MPEHLLTTSSTYTIYQWKTQDISYFAKILWYISNQAVYMYIIVTIKYIKGEYIYICMYGIKVVYSST